MYSDEALNCRICHPRQGCSQCNSGFFKADYDVQCVQCQDTFGTECLHCADFHGCQQCRQGLYRVYNNEYGLYYCSSTMPESESSDTSQITTTKDEFGGEGREELTTTDEDGGEFAEQEPCEIECSSNPCPIEENPYCQISNRWTGACRQCQDGYFYKNQGTPCISCQDTFGEGCVQCKNWNGCLECADGYTKRWDSQCRWSYCESDHQTTTTATTTTLLTTQMSTTGRDTTPVTETTGHDSSDTTQLSTTLSATNPPSTD